MRDRFRFSIVAIFIITGVAAIGFTALRQGGWLWASIWFTLTLAINLTAILAVVYRVGANRAFWVGFALFGWAHFAIVHHPHFRTVERFLFSRQLVNVLQAYFGGEQVGASIAVGAGRVTVFTFTTIVNSISGLACAVIGGMIGVLLYRSGR